MTPDDGHIEVVVADDELDIRLLLRLQLHQAGLTVVGEAEDGHQTLELCRTLRPHVVVLDLLMPRMNGFEVIPVLREEMPEVGIIAYSAVAGDFARAETERWGVPLWLKDGDAEPLVQAIRELVLLR